MFSSIINHFLKTKKFTLLCLKIDKTAKSNFAHTWYPCCRYIEYIIIPNSTKVACSCFHSWKATILLLNKSSIYLSIFWMFCWKERERRFVVESEYGSILNQLSCHCCIVTVIWQTVTFQCDKNSYNFEKENAENVNASSAFYFIFKQLFHWLHICGI